MRKPNGNESAQSECCSSDADRCFYSRENKIVKTKFRTNDQINVAFKRIKMFQELFLSLSLLVSNLIAAAERSPDE